MSHQDFIHHCLSLAKRGRGKTGINPLVGAVLVRDEKVIAQGWHAGFGCAHAERHLLEKFDQKICSDDILYVNLEPCCHTNKKTPPCAQMVIERGVKTVIYGMNDPNPQVSGKGIQMLKDAGVTVIGPILLPQCQYLNRGFVSFITKGRPWITLKKAMTRDGRIANSDGSPLKITSEEQDQWAHLNLRATHDAILVGVGTIMSDDPKLTVRYPHPTYAIRAPAGRPNPLPRGEGIFQPYRIILDPHLRIPLDATVVSDEWRERTILCVKEIKGIEENKEINEMKNRQHGSRFLPADVKEKKKFLQEKGVRIIEIPYHDNHFDYPSLWKALTTPTDHFFGISSILVEGGAKTWESFQSAGMVDEEVVMIN